jgi:hypothetical protein
LPFETGHTYWRCPIQNVRKVSQLTLEKEEAYAASYVKMLKNDAKELEEVAKIASVLDVALVNTYATNTEDLASNP